MIVRLSLSRSSRCILTMSSPSTPPSSTAELVSRLNLHHLPPGKPVFSCGKCSQPIVRFASCLPRSTLVPRARTDDTGPTGRARQQSLHWPLGPCVVSALGSGPRKCTPNWQSAGQQRNRRMNNGQLVGCPASCLGCTLYCRPRSETMGTRLPTTAHTARRRGRGSASCCCAGSGSRPFVLRPFLSILFPSRAHLPRLPVWRMSSVRNGQRCGCSLAGEMPAGEARLARPTPLRGACACGARAPV